MWANHYHSNLALTPVEISLSGLLNTFVSYMSPGQCWEIIISLFKWWNLMFNHWSLMFGMYLKPFLSVAGFKISCWTFLCDYFCLYVPGTLNDKSCLHQLHVTIFFFIFFYYFHCKSSWYKRGKHKDNILTDLCPQKMDYVYFMSPGHYGRPGGFRVILFFEEEIHSK